MINTYNYTVYKTKSNMPLHIVTITSEICACTSVFSTSKHAIDFIKTETESHKRYGITLKYDEAYTPKKKGIENYYINSTIEGMFSKLSNKQMYIR